MDNLSFAESKSGGLVPISGTDGQTGQKYHSYAFLPNNLPETIPLSDKTHVIVNQASSALGRLHAGSSQLPNPALLHRPAIRLEATSTSALEGTFAPFEDVLQADTDQIEPTNADMREVLNYVRTAEYAFTLINTRPLSAGMIKEFQGQLVRGTDGETPDTGSLRDHQVVIGAKGTTISEARFVPPPADDRLTSGFEAWITWVSTQHPLLSPVVQAAMAHYQFETLHPFSDGNGRIGRMIIALQLCRLGELSDGRLLSVSPWLEVRRREYQDLLLAMSQTGDWDPWVSFFAEAIHVQALKASERIRELVLLQTQFKDIARQKKWSGLVLVLADELIGNPVLAAQQVADKHSVTFATANTALAKLVDAQMMTEATGRSYGRRFISEQVFAIIR